MKKKSKDIANKALRFSNRIYHKLRTLRAPKYRNPNDSELKQIELRCSELQMPCQDFIINAYEFNQFVQHAGFPADYHGGIQGGVFLEKQLEHFVAWKLLGLNLYKGLYLDIAACSSPWAMLLRRKGIEAYAVDLSVPSRYLDLDYYRQEDATRTSFENNSVGGASLQCAYEMFLGSKDVDLLRELSRILMTGGRVVISPLYTHMIPCYYQTPEYYGKPYGDSGAKGFVRRDCWGVPASRKYSPETLKSRVWDSSINFGLSPNLLVLRNKHEIGNEIYLHFILVLDK